MYNSNEYNIERYIKSGVDKYLSSEEYVRGLTLGVLDANDIDCIIDYSHEDDIMHSVKFRIVSKRKDLNNSFSYRGYFIDTLEVYVDVGYLYKKIEYDDCNFHNNHCYKVHITTDKYKDYKQVIQIGKLYKYDIQVDISKYRYNEHLMCRNSIYLESHIKNGLANNISYDVKFPFAGNIDCIGWLYENNTKKIIIEYNMQNYREENIDIYDNLGGLVSLLQSKKKGNNIFDLHISYYRYRKEHLVIDAKLCTFLNEIASLFDKVEFYISD